MSTIECLAGCRRVVIAGAHPQLRIHMIETETNDLRTGATMESWSPKKGTST